MYDMIWRMRIYEILYAMLCGGVWLNWLYMLNIIVVEKVKQKCILNKRAECQKLNFEGLIVIILRLFSLDFFFTDFCIFILGESESLSFENR